MQIVEDLQGKLSKVPPGPWSDPPRSAVVVPMRSNIAHELAGLLVLAVSSRLHFDEHYRDFFELVTSQVARAVSDARAYDQERKRAEALAEIDRAKTAFFSNLSQLEQRVVCPDGQVRWMLSRGRPKESDSRCMIGVSCDVTERVRAEQALRESQARLSAILDQVPGGVGLFDHQGNCFCAAGRSASCGTKSSRRAIRPRSDAGVVSTPMVGCSQCQNILERGRSEEKRSPRASTSCTRRMMDAEFGFASARRHFVMIPTRSAVPSRSYKTSMTRSALTAWDSNRWPNSTDFSGGSSGSRQLPFDAI
jgi:hypothetical protein